MAFAYSEHLIYLQNAAAAAHERMDNFRLVEERLQQLDDLSGEASTHIFDDAPSNLRIGLFITVETLRDLEPLLERYQELTDNEWQSVPNDKQPRYALRIDEETEVLLFASLLNDTQCVKVLSGMKKGYKSVEVDEPLYTFTCPHEETQA